MAWEVLISSPTMETTAFKYVVPALALLTAAPLLLQWYLALFLLSHLIFVTAL